MIDAILMISKMIIFWLFMLGCAAAILFLIAYLFEQQKDKRSK